MDLLDESGEIRATAFKAECDRFEPMVEIDKVIIYGLIKVSKSEHTIRLNPLHLFLVNYRVMLYFHLAQIQVYYISNCKLKPANKQYSSLNNDYELTFYEMSDMVPCNDQVR